MVELTSLQLPLDQAVYEAAERIGRRIDMEPSRVFTLLDGRTGVVTRPLQHEKAEAIARALSDEGFAATIRETLVH